MSTVLANPVKMMQQGAPHVIHSDDELESYTKELFKLTAIDEPSVHEREAIALLTLLIEQYEEGHYAIPRADPLSMIRFLMEQNKLKQRDLIPEFGSESAVSMFLSGQRKLNITQIQRLCKRFKVSADIFLHRESK